MKTLQLLSIAAILSLLVTPLKADELADLKAQVAALAARIQQLERVQSKAPTPEAVDASGPELPRFSADFRYRHEGIDEAGLPERTRQRIRARFGLSGQVNEAVSYGVRFATGASNPVSGNATLGGGFSRIDIGLDRAYMTWAIDPNLAVTLGKFATPFKRAGGTQLLWDNDLNPEGAALRWSAGPWSARAAALWVEERSGSSDSFLAGAQLTYDMSLDNGATLTIGGGYYDYLKIEGVTPFFDASGAGNSLTPAGNYANDFNQLEVFAELGTQWRGKPATLFVDYVTNTQASGFDRGYAVGGNFGSASEPGGWQVGYSYQDLEADAVVGTFAGSNFGGGGTDGTGHILEAAYGLAPAVRLNFTYFLNERGANAGNERDYDRIQLDVNFKY